MFELNNEDIEWICDGPCGDTLGRNSYVTMVTTSTGEVVKAEDGRVIDMEPQFSVETEHLCFTCYSAKYKDPVKTLRTVLGVIANVIELLEAETNDDFYNPKAGLDKLNELVVYIAGVLPKTTTLHLTAIIRKEGDPSEKAAAIGVLWVDDEGAEIVEELSVGDTREMGRWTQTVKEIVIREKEAKEEAIGG